MSNTDGKIYIYVTNKLPNEAPVTAKASNGAGSQDKQDNELISHWARAKLIGTIKSVATTGVNYSLNNIGNFTGDYITQANVDNALNNLNSVANIGLTAFAGLKVAGPIGAVVGGSLALISSGVNSALNIHSMQVANRKTNYEIEQLRIRSGLNTLLDGSRGTEN